MSFPKFQYNQILIKTSEGGNTRFVVNIITQRVGGAPKVELIECNHPLYLEQENGKHGMGYSTVDKGIVAYQYSNGVWWTRK